MGQSRLLLVLAALLAIGGLAGWWIVAEQEPGGTGAADSHNPSALKRDSSSADQRSGSAGGRSARDGDTAAASQATAGNTGKGTRNSGEPLTGERDTSKPAEEPVGDKIREGLSDAVSKEASKPKEPQKPKVESSSPEVVATPPKPARVDPRQTLRNLVGDPDGIQQTRQGHHPPRTRSIRRPQPEEVPAASTEVTHGLLGEYWALERDPRHTLHLGEDPAAGAPTFTRLDPNVFFPNRQSFGFPGDPNHVAVRWRGYIRVPEPGPYYFGLGNDVGGALVINGQIIVLNEVLSWYVETWASIQMEAGWHRIEVHHIEGHQGDDPNRNMACVFQWKASWDAQPQAVPTEWLAVPSELAVPLITGISPAIAEVGQQITIQGRELAPDSEVAAETHGGGGASLLGSWEHVQVRIDGLPAKVISVSAGQVVAEVPPGAATGGVEVIRYRVPSKPFPITIRGSQGVMVSLWDMAGYPMEFGTNLQREPDDTYVIDQPFPAVREDYPEYAGRSFMIRFKGRVARHVAGEGPHPVVIETKGGTVADYQFPGLTSTATGMMVRWAFQGATAFTFARSDSGTGSADVRNVVGEVAAPAGGSWVDYELYAIFDHEATQTQSINLRALADIHTQRASHYHPGITVPPAPSIEFVAAATGIPPVAQVNGMPSVPVGGQIAFEVSSSGSTSANATPIQILFDGVPAQTRDHGEPTMSVTIAGGGQPQVSSIRTVIATVPDGCGPGIVRARNGIVMSKPLRVNIANRGLVAMFYDFNDVIRVIPDVTAMAPLVRRIDKHLEFQNGTDFDLPFPAERFSAEWWGSIRIPVDGEYEFHLQSDDGARVRVGTQVVAEFPGLRPPRLTVGKATLTAGWQDLHIEFFENDVLENMVLRWKRPGDTVAQSIRLQDLSTDRVGGIPEKWPAGQLPGQGTSGQ